MMMSKRPTAGPIPRFLLPSILAVLCFPSFSAADEDEGGPPIEELFKTELVFPQEQGELQLGTLPTYRDGPKGTAFVLPIGLEYGITDSLQIEAEWDAYINADATEDDESGSGQGNLSLGLMYSRIDIGDSGFHIAAGFEYEFASGDGKFLEGGNREDSQELYLIFAKDLDERSESQLFLQVGVELQKDGRRARPTTLADLDEDEGTASEDDLVAEDGDDDEFSRHDPNVWFANVGGYTTWNDLVLSLELNLSEEEEERYVTPGITTQPLDNLEVGLGVAVGLTDEADDYQVIAKLVWEFGD